VLCRSGHFQVDLHKIILGDVFFDVRQNKGEVPVFLAILPLINVTTITFQQPSSRSFESSRNDRLLSVLMAARTWNLCLRYAAVVAKIPSE
jgi:hypothetical protein